MTAEPERNPRPARGYTWADFTPGNTAAEKHGANSPRTVAPIATQIEAELIDAAPWLAGAAFALNRKALAWCEAQLVLLRDHIDEKGLLDDKGEPTSGSAHLERLERRAGQLRDVCGLTPMASARLLGALSSIDAGRAKDGLDALKQVGAAILEAASQRALPAGEPADVAESDTEEPCD